MQRVQTFLQGKKTYLMAVIGLLGALVAWADSQIDLMSLLAAAWAAIQTCFIRAGINRGSSSE